MTAPSRQLDYVSPQVAAAAQSTRTPDDVREARIRDLARAKVQAQTAWEAFCKLNRSGLSEDEAVDREIESKRLCRALNDADYALYRAVSA